MELTQEIVRELLDYEPETGKLFWKARDVKWFPKGRYSPEACMKTWETRFANKEALTSGIGIPGRYAAGTLLGKRLEAHRIIWLLVYGEWPDHIDHINGNRSDNRLINLRSISNQENCKNRKLRIDNNSGYPGVYLRKDNGKYTVRIGVNGKPKSLGDYEKLEDAVVARKEAEIKYGYHSNHGKR